MYAMADYTATRDLPSLIPYLHARYSHLPDEAFAAIDAYMQRIVDESGIEPKDSLVIEDGPALEDTNDESAKR